MIEVVDPRAPRAGEVLIEVRAAGVGNWDEFVRAGEWDVGRNPPMALGVEAAGVVAAVGPGAGRLEFTIGASFPLEQAEAALKRASASLGGAVVLEL